LILNVVIPRIKDDNRDEAAKCRKCVENQWNEKVDIRIIEETGDNYPEIFNKAIETIDGDYVLFLFPWVYLRDKALLDAKLFCNRGKDCILMFSFESFYFGIPSEVELADDELTLSEFIKKLHEHPGDMAYSAVWNKIFSINIIKQNSLKFDAEIKEEYQYLFLLKYLNYCNKIITCSNRLASFYNQAELDISETERIKEKSVVFKQFQSLLFNCFDDTQVDSIMNEETERYYIYEMARVMIIRPEDKGAAAEQLKTIRQSLDKKGYIYGCLLTIKVYRELLRGVKRKWSYRKKVNDTKVMALRKRRGPFMQRFYRLFRKPVKCIHRNFNHDKYIFLYCESPTMKPHIFDYYKCIKELPGIKCFIYYPEKWDSEIPEGVSLVKTRIEALISPWDLIVCADVCVPLYYDKCETPIIYINHGLHMISYDGGDSLYAYDRGKNLFSVMLEPNSRYAGIMSKRLVKEHIIHTGYKKANMLEEECKNYSTYRQQLGFAEDDVVVAVFGSWGVDSLFHRVGDALIAQAREMMNNGYKFILSIHPKEYAKYDESIEPLGEYIESLKSEGFTIRNPEESSIKYMVAADLIMSDYSTLCEEGMLAGKTVLLSDFPKERVWKDSIIAKYMEVGPVFSKNSNLKALIEKSFSDTRITSFARELVKDLIPPDNDYKGCIQKTTVKLLYDDTCEKRSINV